MTTRPKDSGISDARERRHAAVLRWLAQTSPSGVTILCAEEAAAPRGISIRLDSCLAHAPLAWLAELAQRTRLNLPLTGCQDQEQTRAAIGFFASWSAFAFELSPQESRSVEVRYDHPPQDRRGLFRSPTEPPAVPAGSHHERLLAALRSLSMVADASSSALSLIAAGCTACGVCVRTCPTQALDLVHEAGRSTLTHRLDSCDGVSWCVSICPVQALNTDGAQPWSAVLAGETVTLATLATTRCQRCGDRFPETSDMLCPACRDQRARPFTSYLPPAAEALLRRRRADQGKR